MFNYISPVFLQKRHGLSKKEKILMEKIGMVKWHDRKKRERKRRDRHVLKFFKEKKSILLPCTMSKVRITP